MNDTKNKFYEELKKQRNIKKISLEEISEYTKINIKYLDALENGDYNCLPNVYSRLFLRSYCDYIGADYKKALDEYEIYTIGNRTKKESEKISLENPAPKENSFTNINLKKTQNYKELIIAAIVITIIIILFIILNLLN